jgi:proline dehydrogenase
MLRTFFVRLSENRSLRGFAERSAIGRRVSGRFVAGTEIADAVRVTQAVNRSGMSVSIDNLGENVTSLKLTHMGLDVDEQLARDIVAGLVAKAAAMKPTGFVRVDMEGSPYTQRTLDFVHELHRMPGNQNCVGTVIQSYLKRSESDVEKLLAEGIRIRLCKGAYKEPASIAFESKADVDANYVKLMKILMKSGIYHGLATHDENIIKQAQAFATRENIARNSFEFQMLYGIRRDLQQKLVRDGWGMRVYVPFGTEWYPYFMRRLGERPANVFFIARNMLRK